MEFVDLGTEENQNKHAEVLKVIDERYLSLPLVAIGGKITMAGEINFAVVYNQVDKMLESTEKPSGV